MAESVSVQQEVFGRAGGTRRRSGGGRGSGAATERARVPDRRAVLSARQRSSRARSSEAQLHVGTVVIRLGRVPFMDATGMHTLSEIIERFQRRGIRVVLCGIQERLSRSLGRAGILALVGPDNICADMAEVAGASHLLEPAGRGIVKIERGGPISGRMRGSGDSLVLSCLARCAASARLLTRSSHHEKHRRTSRWKSACCHLSYCE